MSEPIQKLTTKRYVAEMLIFAVIGIAMFCLGCYAVGHPRWTAWTGTVPMASPTALALLLLSIALLLRK